MAEVVVVDAEPDRPATQAAAALRLRHVAGEALRAHQPCWFDGAGVAWLASAALGGHPCEAVPEVDLEPGGAGMFIYFGEASNPTWSWDTARSDERLYLGLVPGTFVQDRPTDHEALVQVCGKVRGAQRALLQPDSTVLTLR